MNGESNMEDNLRRRTADNKNWMRREAKWLIMAGTLLLSIGGAITKFEVMDKELTQNNEEDKIVHSTMTRVTIENAEAIKAIKGDVKEIKEEQVGQRSLLIEILRAVK